MGACAARVISALIFFVWIQAAAGHGFVHSVIVGGETYPGWNPFADPFGNPSPRVVRKVASDGFVGTSDADLACHHLGDEGTDAVAEAPAGSQIVFQWVYWPGDHQGPVSTYMTSCEGDCSTFSANNARWFKLDDAGFITEGRQWGADKLRADGTSWTSTIPADLAPGEYFHSRGIQRGFALHHTTILPKLRANTSHWRWDKIPIF
ncbi:glycosyl hydrolase family 61-domain-containing protein [Coprinopsis sp. MPI-PUGE-AT-0042]|nr:glycosyl hydrolase family 61-domain-containing protein [Coprinopsis sp. MPI-PUGE-AT-0042]